VALQGRPPAGRSSRAELQLRLTPQIYGSAFWQEVAGELRQLAGELAAYAAQLNAFLKAADRLPEAVLARLAGELVDLKGVRGRLETAGGALLFFVAEDPDFCRWFEQHREGKGRGVKLCAAPLEVAGTLREVLLDRFRTVILTSATLAVGASFAYLAGRTGIALLDRARVTELLLASPFDYAHQALVGIPADLPEPTQPGFAAALCPVLQELLEISRGRAFVLFTSYDLLIKVYEALREPLTRQGLTPMRQGELNRHHLLARFRTGQGAVLFGTDSFWEGVDVQGEALQLVVITRLPFRVPTDPVLEARAEQIAARGGDPFRDYTVPQAVLKFKQGFGRLIRSREDRGAVVILDRRVLSKSYGASFLRSLPETRRVQGQSCAVLAAVRDFFSSLPASPVAQRTGSTGSRRARSG